jgi:hypothetical protein
MKNLEQVKLAFAFAGLKFRKVLITSLVILFAILGVVETCFLIWLFVLK